MDIRGGIATEIRKLFSDDGQPSFAPGDDGPIPPGAVARRVHGDVTTMMIGGYASLLMQMLHPGALAGVWDHSDFRRDMLGRLRRTAQFVAVTTYGGAADALPLIDRVRRIHDGVVGTLPEGAPYSANDPALLAFVHVAETWCFLRAWMRYRQPLMRRVEQDRYFAEMAAVATLLGAPDVPRSRAATDAWLRDVRPALRYDGRTREVARFLLSQPPSSLTIAPFQALTREAGIDLLPDWAKAMHGFRAPARPLVRAGAQGVAMALRWAMTPRPADQAGSKAAGSGARVAAQ